MKCISVSLQPSLCIFFAVTCPKREPYSRANQVPLGKPPDKTISNEYRYPEPERKVKLKESI
jgi:hypothetical protein